MKFGKQSIQKFLIKKVRGTSRGIINLPKELIGSLVKVTLLSKEETKEYKVRLNEYEQEKLKRQENIRKLHEELKELRSYY